MECYLRRFCRLVLMAGFFLMQMISSGISAKGLIEYTIPGEACGYIIDQGDQYEVHTATTNKSQKYPSNVSCSLRFRAGIDQAFLVRITKFNLENSKLCQNDALLIYDGSGNNQRLITKTEYGLCGENLGLPNYFTTTTEHITIKFRTNQDNELDGFKMFVTPFTKDESCEHGFQCLTDKKCLTPDAKCNGAYQCKDGSDEQGHCNLAGSDVRAACHVIILALLLMFFVR